MHYIINGTVWDHIYYMRLYVLYDKEHEHEDEDDDGRIVYESYKVYNMM